MKTNTLPLFLTAILYNKGRKKANVQKCRRFKSYRFAKGCNENQSQKAAHKKQKSLEIQGIFVGVLFRPPDMALFA